MEIKNFGLIETEPGPEDWVLGGDSGATNIVLQEDRNWESFLPVYEPQKKEGFDTYGCVSYAQLNCLETYIKRLWGETWNKSDRFLVVMSDTIPRQGNYMNKVGQAMRDHGAVEEAEYPFGVPTQNMYYQDVPPEIQSKGKEWLNDYETEYEWVDWAGCDNDKLWEGLQYTPLQVTVYAWNRPVDGVYQRYTARRTNHVVTLYKGEYGKYWWIYDHYSRTKKKLAWDFYFGSAMKHTIIKKNDMKRTIKGDKHAAVYAVGDNGKLYHIGGDKSYEELAGAGFWKPLSEVEVLPQAEVDAMPKGKVLGLTY